MKRSNAICEEAIDEQIEPMLTSLGFRRRRNIFFKRSDDCLWSMAMVTRKDPRHDQAWITVVPCVGFYSLAQFLKPCLASEIFSFIDVKTPSAMAANIGYLMPIQNYCDWHVIPETSPNTLGTSVSKAIEQFGLTYFEKYGTLQDVVVAWESGTCFNLMTNVDYYLAAAYWLQGERDKALAFVQSRIDQFADKFAKSSSFPDRKRILERQAFLSWLIAKKQQ